MLEGGGCHCIAGDKLATRGLSEDSVAEGSTARPWLFTELSQDPSLTGVRGPLWFGGNHSAESWQPWQGAARWPSALCRALECPQPGPRISWVSITWKHLPTAGLRPRGVWWDEQPWLLTGHTVVQDLVGTLESGAREK